MIYYGVGRVYGPITFSQQHDGFFHRVKHSLLVYTEVGVGPVVITLRVAASINYRKRSTVETSQND